MATKIYVLFHASCLDGAASRFAAWKKFGDEATYIPVQYGKALPLIEDRSDVYILDFSYSREILDELNNRSNLLVVLDHHKTAKDALEGATYATFDLNRSGAVMSWEYFHPNTPVPKLLQHVQDRDLWRFNLEDTKEICEGFRTFSEDMSSWDMAIGDNADGVYFLDAVKTRGKTVLDYIETLISSAVRNVKIVQFLNYKVGIVNATNLISEIGNAIYTSKELCVDFSISYFVTNDASVILSFRSPKGMDVSEIAKALGGGGHPQACGAKINLVTLQKILDGNFTTLNV